MKELSSFKKYQITMASIQNNYQSELRIVLGLAAYNIYIFFQKISLT